MKHRSRNDQPTRRKSASFLLILGLASGFVAASILPRHHPARAAAVAALPLSHGPDRPSNHVASSRHDCVWLLSTRERAVPAPRPHHPAAVHRSVDHGSHDANPQTGCPDQQRTAVLV